MSELSGATVKIKLRQVKETIYLTFYQRRRPTVFIARAGKPFNDNPVIP
jgi:hypothetical protein